MSGPYAEGPLDRIAAVNCEMLCDQPAEFYVTAKTTVPMVARMPLCLRHAADYGRQAVEVATIGPMRIFTVEVKLEPVVLADLLTWVDAAIRPQDA